MAKVFLHWKNDPGSDAWINEVREFARIPCNGEFVALDAHSPWYQVYAIVHLPFEAQFQAEVFLHEPLNDTEVTTKPFKRST